MQTRREYAASLGLAKAGARGKFSTAAKEAIAKAEAGGMTFSDTPTAAPVVKATGDSTKNSGGGQIATKSDPGMTPYLTPDEYRFPEREYKGITFDNGKRREVSLRECCNTCRVSLVNHGCDSPTILGGIAVKIERR